MNRDNRHNKTPHPHAELIAEWIKDTSRVVQFETYIGGVHTWVDTSTPSWYERIAYRFKPEEPPKPKIVSSLTEQEIEDLWNMVQDRHAVSNYKKGSKSIADGAAQRAIDDLEMPSIDLIYIKIEESRLSGASEFGSVFNVLKWYLEAIKKGEL